MLQKLHEKISGWVASVIIGLLCLVFILWGIEYYVGGTPSQGVAIAEVDGIKITEQAVGQLVRQLQRQESARGVVLSDPINQQLKSIAVQNLIAEVALSHAAPKLGFTVQQQQLQQVVGQIFAFQENGQFSPQRFQQFLYDRGMNQQQLLAQLKTEILINQVRMGIQESAFLLPSMSDYYYHLFFQTRSFHYLTIPAQAFIHKVAVDTQAEQTYYDNNKESLRVPEQVSIEYIELSPAQISKTLTISDAELQQYYKDHLGNYTQPATWSVEQITVPVNSQATSQQVTAARQQVEGLLKKIKSGIAFEALYKAQNGTTATLNEGTVSPEVANILKQLRLGQVSQPFNTAEGFQIVRLLSGTPATTESFAAVKDRIRTLLTQQKTQQRLTQLNEQLSDLVFTNPESLEPAAEALKVGVQTSALFTEQGGASGIAADPVIVQVAFSKDVLQHKNNSKPMTLKDGRVVALRVKKYVPSQIPDFSEVQSKIQRLLVEQYAQAKAALLATEISQMLQQGQSLQTVLQENQLHWQAQTHIQRDNKKIPAEIDRK